MSVDNERPTSGQENEIDARSILVARFVDESLLPKVDWLEDEPINDEVSAKVDINLKNILEDFYYFGESSDLPTDIRLGEIIGYLQGRMRTNPSGDEQIDRRLRRAFYAVGRLIFDGWTPAIQSNDTDHR